MDGPQTRAFRALLGRNNSILVGGPGTGKSLVMRNAIEAHDTSLKKEDWCVIMCATHTACAGFTPAGRARTIASFVGAGGKDIPSDPNDPRSVKMALTAFKNSLDKVKPLYDMFFKPPLLAALFSFIVF